MRVITDHKWKPFRYRYEVPARILKSEFDYQDPEDTLDGFFCYRGIWYHLDQFEATQIEGYHGFHPDSFFSGVAIRISDDGEQYQVATLIS